MTGIEIFGPQKKFRFTFMTLLKLFILCSFPRENSKNGELGNLWLVRLAVLSLTAGIKNFGSQKNFRYTFMVVLKLFYFMNFSSCLLKNGAGKLRLSWFSRFDSHGWN